LKQHVYLLSVCCTGTGSSIHPQGWVPIETYQTDAGDGYRRT